MYLIEFKTSTLKRSNFKTLLRDLSLDSIIYGGSRIYRSLVKRMHEIGAISAEQYAELYSVDEDLQGEYGKIGQTINKEVFLKLNQPTKNIGTSP